MAFHPAGQKALVLPGHRAGMFGAVAYGIPSATAEIINITVNGADLAANALAPVIDPIALTDAATWIWVGITTNEALTTLRFAGTNGVTYAYPGALAYASLNAGSDPASGTTSYFAVNVTNALTQGSLAFTATASEGELEFTIPVTQGINASLSSITGLSNLVNYMPLNNSNLDIGSAAELITGFNDTRFEVPDAGAVFGSCLYEHGKNGYRYWAPPGTRSTTYTIGFFLWIDSFVGDGRYINLSSQGTSGASNNDRLYAIQAYDQNSDGAPLLRFVKFRGGSATVVLSTTALTTDQWQYIEIRMSSGAYSFYIDGEPAGGTTMATGQNTDSRSVCLGRALGDGTDRDQEHYQAHWYFRNGTLNSESERNAILLEGLGIVGPIS